MNWLRTLLAVFATASLAPAADWTQWLGPKRDGSSTEAVEPWKDAPKEVWRKDVGVGFSSPVVAAGRVFVHARVANKEQEEVITFDAKTGTELWRKVYDRAKYSSVLNTGPQATPTVVGKRLYTFGITGVLSCFNAETGDRHWQVDAFKALKANLPRFGVCCSPLVVGNRVIVSVGGKGSSVVAFDTESGEVAWQALDEPASTSSPVLYAAAGKAGKVPGVVFMTTLRVIGLNPLDGTVAWEYPLPFQPSGTSPTPIVAGDRIVTSTMSNGSTAIQFASGETVTADKAWQAKSLSGYFSSGVAAKDRVFLVTNTLKPIPRADLVCVNLSTGDVLWKKDAQGYFHFGLIRTANGKLLLLDDTGTLKLLDATATEFRALCSAKVCGGNLVTPALSDGRLFVRDDAGLACLALVP
ncbi:PQQ-binding-like beta-propeller repeat protein [Limnoglobus roseus]|uniref:Alcohol dehydrogenase n=1 Tax=Limnoglobus roseus TaxID=2598579 RepID=A0A5C1A9Y1_9BACT|nr:PQQ-binding-like beta-propeller repeat protein [Limnoglobus roseus]QEL14993.1 alcohol dehydrogenase [Limnoglobus roseus]